MNPPKARIRARNGQATIASAENASRTKRFMGGESVRPAVVGELGVGQCEGRPQVDRPLADLESPRDGGDGIPVDESPRSTVDVLETLRGNRRHSTPASSRGGRRFHGEQVRRCEHPRDPVEDPAREAAASQSPYIEDGPDAQSNRPFGRDCDITL